MSILTLARYARSHKNSMLLCVFLSGLGTYLWRATDSIPPLIRCTLDKAFLSKTARAQLKTYIMQQHAQAIKPRELIKNLKNSFLWIKDTTLNIQPQSVAIILHIHTPFLIINDALVVTKDGHAFEKDIFDLSSTASLPAIAIDPPALHDAHTIKDVALFMQQLPTDLLNFYTITWKNSHTIYLTDKVHKNFVLITSTDRALSSKKLYNCLWIKQNLHTQLVKKPTDQWSVDVRFTDTIIVTKRGNTHGTHVS